MPRAHRSTAFYRIVLGVPLIVHAYLIVSGRLAAQWRMFDTALDKPIDEAAFRSLFLTNLIGVVVAAPLFLAAWEIGRENTAARRRGYDVLLGLWEVVRRAFGREPGRIDPAVAARPPRDNPRRALALGAATAVTVPVFFAGFLPMLRVPLGLVWLGGAGILMGSLTYAHYRATAYLRDEPARFDLFRNFRLMDTSRYDEAGHAFVRWERVGGILLMIWWLGGGAYVFDRL